MNKRIYDVLIIGGGISASVFSSCLIKNNFKVKIALFEAGRKLGGRSSTRVSKNYKGWELNHGSPNLNILNRENNVLLRNFIDELLKNKVIKFDDSDVVDLIKDSNLINYKDFDFSSGENYCSISSMSDLSKNIISINNLRNQIDFFFETKIVDLVFDKNQWVITTHDGEKFRSQYLVCSSNLLLHKRSLEILNTNKIPLRNAIPENCDKKIDQLFYLLNQQSYIPEVTFLIYPGFSYKYKDNYMKKIDISFLIKI